MIESRRELIASEMHKNAKVQELLRGLSDEDLKKILPNGPDLQKEIKNIYKGLKHLDPGLLTKKSDFFKKALDMEIEFKKAEMGHKYSPHPDKAERAKQEEMVKRLRAKLHLNKKFGDTEMSKRDSGFFALLKSTPYEWLMLMKSIDKNDNTPIVIPVIDKEISTKQKELMDMIRKKLVDLIDKNPTKLVMQTVGKTRIVKTERLTEEEIAKTKIDTVVSSTPIFIAQYLFEGEVNRRKEKANRKEEEEYRGRISRATLKPRKRHAELNHTKYPRLTPQEPIVHLRQHYERLGPTYSDAHYVAKFDKNSKVLEVIESKAKINHKPRTQKLSDVLAETRRL